MKKLLTILILALCTGCAGQYTDRPAFDLRVCDYTEDEAHAVLSAAVDRVNLQLGPHTIKLRTVDCADGPWWARVNATQDIHSGTGLRGSFWTGSALYWNTDVDPYVIELALHDMLADADPVLCEEASVFGCE